MRLVVPFLLLLATAAPLVAQATQPATTQAIDAQFKGVHLKNDDDGGYEVILTVAGKRYVRTLDPYDEETLPADWDEVTVKVVDQPPLVARRGEFIVIKNGELFRHARRGP